MKKSPSILPSIALLALVVAPIQAQQRRDLTPQQRAQMQAEREAQIQADLQAERPIEALKSVWIEELTWMEVRDVMADGKTTALITTGGIEQNGPYLATGKHNYVLQGACEGVARALGNALCAPIIKLVPEGDIDEPSGHMRYPGTISLRQETYEAVLEDVAASLRAHGFKHIVFFGDSGGNQSGMEAATTRLNERWQDATAHFIPEFYRYGDVHEWMNTELGIAETTNDGIHDDFVITSIMMVTDPTSVRYDQRVAAGKATINGLSIAPKEEVIQIGKKLLDFRIRQTVNAIQASIGGTQTDNDWAVGGTVLAQSVNGHGEDVTFNRDVMPILQAKCQECHQPNSIAPMSLLAYRDAYRWADRIREKVANRVMPPWHIDRTMGIQDFKNDRGLNDTQIETIVAWVDGGRIEGDPANLPPTVEFPDPAQWRLGGEFGEPNLIVKSEPYTLAAHTQDKWFRPVVETGLTEPRWVKAIEIKPSFPEGRQIVHHTLAYLIQNEQGGLTNLASTAHEVQRGAGLFMEWAVGKEGEVFNEDAGKLMLPGSRIGWEVHMHAIGKEVKDNQVELGIWFYPKGYTPKNRTVLRMLDARGRTDLDIPPGEIAVTQDFHVLQAPARLENFQPHMHMRGKAMSLEAIYPDGRKELINQVNNFQWNWHNNYIYADAVAPLFPKGTTLVITAWHDNTADNPHNPDPEQWVGWGDRTVDEMAHLWVDVTYLEQDDYERQVAAREEAKQVAEEQGSSDRDDC